MEKVIVIDFGSQTVQLIAKLIRNANVYCEILPHTTSFEKVRSANPSAVILSGGNASCYLKGAPTIDKEVFNLGVPVLAICYGFQLMNMLLGGITAKADVAEFGKTAIDCTNSLLFDGLPSRFDCWMSHYDGVKRLAEGFEVVATTADCSVAVAQNANKGLYGVQYHPEVANCQYGKELILNFLFKVCHLKGDWSLNDFIADTVNSIKQQVGDKKVLCALSGGVDSAVAATLVHKAVGDNLICVFVDHGFMRKNEAEQVVEVFRNQRGFNLIALNEEQHFLSAIEGVNDPERKRKIIGEEFIRVFERQAKLLGKIDYLVQGTIYPDIIESGINGGETIKSHHNVGGLPSVMDFTGLIEPVNHLFKDEVRQVGLLLGLPENLVFRQPFPGPGLAVRVLGEVTKEKLDILREADYAFRDEIAKAGLDREIWQYFAVLPPVQSTGVMGDRRTFLYTIALRAVSSLDAMTADWYKIPYDVLEKASARITNTVQGVNRVVYDITAKPPSTIEWE